MNTEASMTDLTEFTNAVTACLNTAIARFDLNITAAEIPIKYYKNGKSAGFAGWNECKLTGKKDFYLRFNMFNISNDYERMMSEVIPHEVAHIVCMVRPIYGKDHNAGWVRICKALGGNGKRTHDMEVERARPVRKRVVHVYKINGEEFVVGPIIHKKIQARKAKYLTKKGRYPILPEHYTTSRTV